MTIIRTKPLEEKPPIPKYALIAMVTLVVGVITLGILIRSTPSENVSQESVFEEVQAADVSAPQGVITIGYSNITLYIPNNAINMEGVISMTARPSNSFPVAKEQWNRPQIVSIEFKDKAGKQYSHITLEKPARVCFVLSSEGWQEFSQSPDEFQVQYYADDKNPLRWEALPLTTVPERYQLCGETKHLSTFALAVKFSVVVPVTGATPSVISQASPTDIDQREGEGQPTNAPATNPPRTPPPVVTDPPPTEPTEPPPPTEPPTEPPDPTEEPTEPPAPTDEQEPTEPPVPTEPPAP